MKTPLRFVLCFGVLSAAALSMQPGALIAAPAKTSATKTTPKVIAAIFEAEWCGACKAMKPAVMQTMKAVANQPVRFVKFDLTNEKTTAQSAKVAQRNGITPVFKSNTKTGLVFLVDAKTRRVVGKLDSGDSAAQMKAKIQDALAGKAVAASKPGKTVVCAMCEQPKAQCACAH